MKTKITKFITRKNCPETNSSSSHSFVFSREVFQGEDLLLSTQTISPSLMSDGKKVAIFDGRTDSYEPSNSRRVNDSRSKALYAFGAARVNYGRDKGKKKLEEIKKVIIETLKIDEVKVSHWNDIEIDHQSHDTLKIVLESGYEGIKEFIFNPRVYLFLLWDSEDCYDNPIFDVCKGIFNFEVSIKFPIKVEKFLSTPELQEIEFTKLSRNYPTTGILLDICNDIMYENELISYSSTTGSMTEIIQDPARKYVGRFDDFTEDKDDILEYLCLAGLEEDVYVVFVKSSLWGQILEKMKKSAEIPKDPTDSSTTVKYNKEFEDIFNDIRRWWRRDDEASFNKYIVKQLLRQKRLLLTKDDLNLLGLTEEDIKLFKTTIYSRETNGIF